MYDAYCGQVAVDTVAVDAALKYINFASFMRQEDCGGKQLHSLWNEMSVLSVAEDLAPGIAPRAIGLWSWASKEEQYILALEHCGDVVVDVADPSTAEQVREAYSMLHAAGVVHNDVQHRHILRDAKGCIRVIDWEAGSLGTPEDCAAERARVEDLVRHGFVFSLLTTACPRTA